MIGSRGLSDADRAAPIKSRSDELAVTGAAPAFAEPLHVGRPNLGDVDRFLARMQEALRRRWLTNDGPYVQELEARLREVTGAEHVVATCNATVALEILARALELSGEVLVPSFTFVATAHALQWLGIRPVFCDVDPATHTLDPEDVSRRITPRTSAILGVHVWGRVCEVDALADLADRRGLSLVFDAAHALGCSRDGRSVGGFGRAEVFSFHATKFVNAFEGGAVTTNDAALAERLRLMRNFGFAGFDHVVSVGTNGKMSEASAAMGLTTLDAFDEIVEANRRHHRTYASALGGVSGLRLVTPDQQRWNHQYVVLEVSDDARLSRDELQGVLWAEGVMARRYFFPGCHAMEPYRSLPNVASPPLPVTNRLVERILCLPTGTAVTTADVQAVCAVVRVALADGAAIRPFVSNLPRALPSAPADVAASSDA